MKKIWSVLMNVILIVTSGSYRLALRVTKFHFNVLKSKIVEPFILGLYNSYEPKHSTYVSDYNTWKKAQAYQLSKTNVLDKKLGKNLTAKLRGWISLILPIYDVDTPEYKALLPHGRKPFNTGGQSERIEAIQEFAEAMGSDPLLAAIKADVLSYYSEANDAFESQKGAIAATSTASNKLENSRIEMANAQFANLGLLIAHYVTNLEYVEVFFDLKALRSRVQLIFEKIVKELSIYKIVERTVKADDLITFENTGVTELCFYKSSVKNGKMGLVFISVAPGASKTVKASEAGDINFHFWMVYNPDDTNKGSFILEFV